MSDTATIQNLPEALTETIRVRWNDTTRRVSAAPALPGLYITQHIDPDGKFTPGRYNLTIATCGLQLATIRCATHIYEAVDVASRHPAIDWDRGNVELKSDQHVRAVFDTIRRDVPYCDIGDCPGGNINISRWCANQAEAFRTFENREMAMYPDDEERDTALLEWVLRVLARPENPGTAEVLEAIEHQRAVTA